MLTTTDRGNYGFGIYVLVRELSIIRNGLGKLGANSHSLQLSPIAKLIQQVTI
jgi:hypothetical protein